MPVGLAGIEEIHAPVHDMAAFVDGQHGRRLMNSENDRLAVEGLWIEGCGSRDDWRYQQRRVRVGPLVQAGHVGEAAFAFCQGLRIVAEVIVRPLCSGDGGVEKNFSC